MQLKVHLTINNERNTYRLALEDDAPINNYDYLRAALLQKFPVLQQREFRMTWLDSDNDQVTISSSEDMRMFLLSNMDSDTKTLYIESRDQPTPDLPTFTVHLGESSPNNATPPSGDGIHRHVHCDGCNGRVTGNRYKCLECHDFDLCENCEAAGQHREHAMMRTADVNLFSSNTGRVLLQNIAHLMRMVRGNLNDPRREHKEAKRCFKQLKKHHGGPGGKKRDSACGEGRDWPYGFVGPCPIVDQVQLAPLLNMGIGFVNSLYDHAAAAASAAAGTAQASTASQPTASSTNCHDATQQGQPPSASAGTDQPTPQPEATTSATNNELPQYQLPPFNFHDMLQNLMGHVAAKAPQPTQPQTNTANVDKPATETISAAAAVPSDSSPAVSIHSVHSSIDASAAGMDVDPKDKDTEGQQGWTLIRVEDEQAALAQQQLQAQVPQQPQVPAQVQQVYPTLPSAPAVNPTSSSPVLRLLHEMGFNHDDIYLNHMLQRYENNISQVVKHLVDVSNGTVPA